MPTRRTPRSTPVSSGSWTCSAEFGRLGQAVDDAKYVVHEFAPAPGERSSYQRVTTGSCSAAGQKGPGASPTELPTDLFVRNTVDRAGLDVTDPTDNLGVPLGRNDLGIVVRLILQLSMS